MVRPRAARRSTAAFTRRAAPALLLATALLGAACGDDDGDAVDADPAAVAVPSATQPVGESPPLLSGRETELPYQDIVVDGRTVRMWDIVGKDAIPAIFEPQFIAASDVGDRLRDEELVIGVSINGEHHAYSVALLSRHEVVNDVVGSVPLAVTW